MNLLSNLNLDTLINIARALLPMGQSAALAGIQRALTMPQRDVRALGARFNRDEADILRLLRLREEIAEETAKFVLVLAAGADLEAD